VLDLPNNRSNMGVEADFSATWKLSTRVGLAWQRSHGGLRSTEVLTEEQISQYDRIIKDNSFTSPTARRTRCRKVDVLPPTSTTPVVQTHTSVTRSPLD
jgi:hypothetical protein